MYVAVEWSVVVCHPPPQVSGAEEADAMQFFLCKEAANRFDVAQDTARALELANEEFWSIRPATEIPRQHDDVNCGVFALVFAECLCIGYPLRSCALNDATMDSARARLADLLLQVCNCRSVIACIPVFARRRCQAPEVRSCEVRNCEVAKQCEVLRSAKLIHSGDMFACRLSCCLMVVAHLDPTSEISCVLVCCRVLTMPSSFWLRANTPSQKWID